MTRNDAPRAHQTGPGAPQRPDGHRTKAKPRKAAVLDGIREASGIRERDLQTAVIELARYLHLLTYHTHDSRRSAPGFPDLVVVGPGGVLYRELKSSTGRIRPEQQVWLDRLTTAGADAGVWRPDDWTNGTIRTELERTAS